MARKRKEQKSGLYQHSQNNKKGVSDPGPVPLTTEDRADVNEKKVDWGEELSNGSHSVSSTKSINDMGHVQDGKRSKQKSRKSQRKEKKGVDETITEQAVPCNDSKEVGESGIPTNEASNIRDGSDISANDKRDPDDMCSFNNVPNGLHKEDGSENVQFPETMVLKFIRALAVSVAKASAEWVERHKPILFNLKTNILKACDDVRMSIQHAQPFIFSWIMHIRNLMLLLFMVWLDCSLRGMVSFLRMETPSFFSIVWCSALSVIAMVGVGKFLVLVVIAAAVGLFIGFTFAFVLIGIAGMIFLWFYGSFWTTGLIIFLGGLALALSHDRVALFITSLYSVYCAWNYVGWLGILLGLNLSFISSDALLFFLRNTINEQRRADSPAEQSAGMQSQQSFSPSESPHASSTETGAGGLQADRSPGVPSTSGSTSETSEDEVLRLLKCTDHYAALGLSRFENIDVSVIKREYRKKAMLVHPDKNMGNDKAAEAFKKLQNAYEVLLDSFKRKEYDDELRREELLNYVRKFENASHENNGHGLFASSFPHTEADSNDSLRRIACSKCGFFHVWFYTKKSKSRARWCQECKDFHQAKDGDGWVEQSSQPFFFGILQKVEAPAAYICADGKVYDVTEWFICQGMRCPVNTHKPTFHVNANIISKNGHSKGTSSGQKGGIPASNMEDTMTEDEFFDWLKNAMERGMFENFTSSASESPSGFNPKGGGGSSSSSTSKRKKKGKKQW